MKGNLHLYIGNDGGCDIHKRWDILIQIFRRMLSLGVFLNILEEKSQFLWHCSTEV